MNATLDFPEIVPPAVAAPAPTTATPPPASVSERTVLAKIDVQSVALARFGDWRPQATALIEKYKDVAFDPSTAKGYKELSAAIAEIRAPRFAAQNVDKNFATEITQIRKAVASEKDQIIAFLAATEKQLVDQKEAHDTKVREEEEAKAAKEQARRDAHQANITTIYSLTQKATGLNSIRLKAAVDYVDSLDVSAERFEEFAGDAALAVSDVRGKLQSMLDETLRLENQAAENERLRLESEAAKRLLDGLTYLGEIARDAAGQSAAQIAAAIAHLKAGPYGAEDAPPAIAATLENTLGMLERMQASAAQNEKMAAQLAALQPAEAPAPAVVADEQPTSLAAPQAPGIFAIAGYGTSTPAPVPVPAAPAAQDSGAVTPAVRTITTGQLNEALGFTVTAGFLTSLGFTPTIVPKKAGSFWLATDIKAICQAIAAAAVKVGETGL